MIIVLTLLLNMLLFSLALASPNNINSLFLQSFSPESAGLGCFLLENTMLELTEEDKERFWSHVDKTNECWLWTGCSISKGYGHFWRGKTSEKSHRVSYILSNGSIPKGMFICHTCDNPPCVNPEHLYAGTCSQNSIDMVSRNRSKSQKLKVSDIPVIISLNDTLNYREISEIYGVNPITIGDIFRGETWSHVTGIIYKTTRDKRRRINQ